MFFNDLIELTNHHIDHCESYKRLVTNFLQSKTTSSIKTLDEIPFIHVSVFKESILSSIDERDVFKTLKSSGTTGSQSIIKIDRNDAQKQNEVLYASYKRCVSSNKRIMLVVDKDPREIIKNEGYVARAAGIVGFGSFCLNRVYLIDKNGDFSFNLLDEALRKYKNVPILLFGLTPHIWQRRNTLRYALKHLNLKDIVVLHGGGWKKLEVQSVTKKEFDDTMHVLGAMKVINYYGMVEQLGSVFFACSNGHFHAHDKARAIARDITSLKPIDNHTGVMQFLSTVPRSYPGHSILTDDLGILHTDICGCGDENEHFTIIGRHKESVIRGCGNT